MRRIIGFLLWAVLLSGVPARAAAKEAEEVKEINLLAWSEYVPQAVIDGFKEETGISVNYEAFASNEEMLSKLLADPSLYDLIQPSEYTAEALIRDGRLAALDHGKLPNLRHLAPEFLDHGYDRGLKYCVPWMAGTVGISVNTAKVKEPVRGFADLFSGRYAGRIVAVNDNREILTWALIALGRPINRIDAEALAAARPLVERWVRQIKVFDSDSPKTALLNGDVDLGLVWSGEGAKLHQEDKKFAFVVPVEGTHLFVDNLAIPKESKRKEQAHRFMDYILRPEVSVLISREFPYLNPNASARKLLTAEELANPASYPDFGWKAPHMFEDIGEAAAEIDRVMTDLRSD